MKRTEEDLKNLAPHHTWRKDETLIEPRQCVVLAECVLGTLRHPGDKVNWMYSGPLPPYLRELDSQEIADIEADDPAVAARETGEVFPEGSPQASAISMRDAEIRAALDALDHQNNDHWSQGHLPKVKVVNRILQTNNHKLTTLAEIRVIAPQFIRELDAAEESERAPAEDDIFGDSEE